MNATSPLLGYTRAFLTKQKLLAPGAALVIDEESITSEMIGLLRRRKDFYAFTCSPWRDASPLRCHVRQMRHEKRQGRLAVRYVPIIEARFTEEGATLALESVDQLQDSPFDDADRLHAVLVHELLYYVYRHAAKSGRYEFLRLPAAAPVPRTQYRYEQFCELSGWPPPRNGFVLVPLGPASPGELA